ncbi:uncharacterized protein LOC125272808 [Megalobrama amblycephala]|uniref:uncharacterized protein LOC125272808 n=1 Tax=Megalobrama amblycephala TaxID=75352 RepID=UPI0020141035|nr:uncharacterized protein LOC125272808 [Megalobrama amblycephala]
MGGQGSKSEQTSSAVSNELDEPWRTFDWRQKELLKTSLENFRLSNPDVKHIRILVAGQIGAGKSSFINSVSSAFQGEIVCEALSDTSQSAASHSFTQRLKICRIRSGDADLPFEICDVIGLDPDKLSGCQTDEIVKTIYGHVREGYKFSENPNPNKDEHYQKKPSLSDQAFCLVYVIAADTIGLIRNSDNKILHDKLKAIRQEISDNGIPQVIVMTKVDEACPLVKNNLKKVFLSKKIKKKMEMCSGYVGVPMSSIFPVKNYHDETDTNDDVDVLILKAFDQIVRFANGRLRGEPGEPWRKFDWGEKELLKTRLEKFSLSNPEVQHIRILVAGQIGAGKSSFINSVSSAFQGEIVCEALSDTSQSAASHSFTQRLNVYRIRSSDADLPFEICDVMGLEPEKLSGCQTDDIVKTIYGQVREGYKFSENPISNKDEHYNENPSLSDQAFCLVYIIAADTVPDNLLIEKLKVIRQRISDNDIPQVIVMTKVDEACPLVKNNLKKVFLSKKIKEKMELCSGYVGVPMSSIFPVKNYHDETDTNDDVDVLILKAFDRIVRFANGRLRRGAYNL